MVSLDDGKLEAIQRLCTNGETVQWVGQPDVLLSMRRRRALPWMGLFALLIAAASFTMIFLVLPKTAPTTLFTWGAVFCVIAGLFLMAAPTLAGRSAKRTIYALTNSRALIVTLNKGGPVIHDSCELKTAGNIVFRQEDKSGYGDIALNYKEVDNGDGFVGTGFSFIDIPDVLNVKALAEKLVKNASGVPPKSDPDAV